MKLELPDHKKEVFRMTMPIRWGDMDALGHVNNTVYFRYMEILRIEWMRSLGGPPRPEGLGTVVVNAFCNYHRSLEYPGDMLLRMYVSPPGKTSLESWATIGRVDDPGVVYASGGVTTVWADLAQGRAVPLPEWLLERLR